MTDGRLKLKDWFSTNLILKETKESELYSSIEELKNAQFNDPNELGEINWEKWEQVVDETRKKLSRIKLYVTKTVVQAYDLQGKLISQYDSYSDAAKDWATTPELVGVYVRQKRPYIKQKVFFMTKEIRVPREKH